MSEPRSSALKLSVMIRILTPAMMRRQQWTGHAVVGDREYADINPPLRLVQQLHDVRSTGFTRAKKGLGIGHVTLTKSQDVER